MTANPRTSIAPDGPTRPAWPVVLKRLAIWGLFLAVLYLTRRFFFTGFMTFMFCYLTLAAVGWGMKRLSPDRDRIGLRRLLTVVVFVLVLVALVGAGTLIAPRLLAEGERLAAWLSHVSPETEVARVLEDIIGPYQWKQRYGDPQAADYQNELDAFRTKNNRSIGPSGEFSDAVAARMKADFQATKQHELFQEWWNTSAPARFIRHHLEAGVSDESRMAVWAERIVSTILDIPISLGTALLLSFFICIDFPQLRRGVRRLRETWLRDAYDEIVPALSGLGQLVGRSMRAQGLVALCDATMIFIALTILGVEHQVLLSLAVFVLCLIPTLGAIISWLLIATFALFQPGGGLALALKVTGAFAFVALMESFVLGPRILGRLMELHPVLIIAILPVAQYFFGIWGMILAAPVAVYVIHVVILGHGLPGTDSPGSRSSAAGKPAAPPLPASGGNGAEGLPHEEPPESLDEGSAHETEVHARAE